MQFKVVFHNGSKYGYHFIINQLAKEFDSQLKYLGENTEKYIGFSVPIKKELDNNKKKYVQTKIKLRMQRI